MAGQATPTIVPRPYSRAARLSWPGWITIVAFAAFCLFFALVPASYLADQRNAAPLSAPEYFFAGESAEVTEVRWSLYGYALWIELEMDAALADAHGVDALGRSWYEAVQLTDTAGGAVTITHFGDTLLVGYHTEGDRAVLRGVGAVVALLGAVWALAPSILVLRPLLIALASVAALWTTMPITEAGTVPSRSGEAANVVASFGPWGILAVSLALIAFLVLARDSLTTARYYGNVAARASARQYNFRAIALVRRALTILETEQGPDNPETMATALEYATCLALEGYDQQAEAVLDALEQQLAISPDPDLQSATAEVRAWITSPSG